MEGPLSLPMGQTTQSPRLDAEGITAEIQAMYTDVADEVPDDLHFPVGRKAARAVGYPAEALAGLPEQAVESFAGVGYPFQIDAIEAGDTVLDIGSGSGTDLLIAADRVGPQGRAFGLELTPAMSAKCLATLETAGAHQAFVLQGDAGDGLPFPDGSVDVVTSNGVLNLVVDKPKAFQEIHRVLKPGGTLQLADIVVNVPIPDEARGDGELWAACIAGAALQDDYLGAIRAAGFGTVEVVDRLDYFANAPREDARETAAHYKAEALVLAARR